MAFIPYVWDVNDTNTAPLPAPLLSDGYAPSAIPTSTEFNELWRNVSGLIAAVNSLFRPGTLVPSFSGTAMNGWIRYEDGTIGSALSGGTLLSDASAENLYSVIWDEVSDINAPVIGGRGASPAADFAANKPITMPLMNGRTLVSGPFTYSNGSAFGAATHVLLKSETPPHIHTIGQSRDWQDGTGGVDGVAQLLPASVNSGNGAEDGLQGLPHNITQASVSVFYFIKL